ncbi:hypothetical protein D9619_000324 [Psilocybe cf. subviscida]|uniref:Uncharacterized protein n=1 Tax=Psilocybe cf. subviscida TaxID=2480587 RepID=A0A8H5BG28_9AGAR|nr:hypothetical protein D9619_000324 [Psilocybe cf. subviscida]
MNGDLMNKLDELQQEELNNRLSEADHVPVHLLPGSQSPAAKAPVAAEDELAINFVFLLCFPPYVASPIPFHPLDAPLTVISYITYYCTISNYSAWGVTRDLDAEFCPQPKGAGPKLGL